MYHYAITIDPQYKDQDQLIFVYRLDNDARIELLDADTKDGSEIWTVITTADIDLQLDQQPGVVSYEVSDVETPQYVSAGRPPLFDRPMRQTAIWLTEDQIAWLKSQDGTMSEAMRRLIQAAMEGTWYDVDDTISIVVSHDGSLSVVDNGEEVDCGHSWQHVCQIVLENLNLLSPEE